MRNELLAVINQLEEIHSDLLKTHHPLGAKVTRAIDSTKQILNKIPKDPIPRTRKKPTEIKERKMHNLNQRLNDVWEEIMGRKNNEQAIA